MLDLGKKNLIIRGKNSHFVLSSIFEFYDLIGLNLLVLHDDTSDLIKNSNSNHLSFNKKNYKKILGNLFNVDILIVSSTISNAKLINIDLPTIYVNSSKGEFDQDFYDIKFDYVYKVWATLSNINFATSTISVGKNTYYIEDVKNNWVSTFEELKTTYIRDKKLEKLFKK